MTDATSHPTLRALAASADERVSVRTEELRRLLDERDALEQERDALDRLAVEDGT